MVTKRERERERERKRERERERERERDNVLFNDTLNTFSYGYMAPDIWLRTIMIGIKETHCCHMGYVF